MSYSLRYKLLFVYRSKTNGDVYIVFVLVMKLFITLVGHRDLDLLIFHGFNKTEIVFPFYMPLAIKYCYVFSLSMVLIGTMHLNYDIKSGRENVFYVLSIQAYASLLVFLFLYFK